MKGLQDSWEYILSYSIMEDVVGKINFFKNSGRVKNFFLLSFGYFAYFRELERKFCQRGFFYFS